MPVTERDLDVGHVLVSHLLLVSRVVMSDDRD
jgi:hypothetical protein